MITSCNIALPTTEDKQHESAEMIGKVSGPVMEADDRTVLRISKSLED
jgi:hypothetical protein